MHLKHLSFQRLAMDPRCKGMPLSSFILKPMQRVTRYPLIIKNVSSHLTFSSRRTLAQHFRDPGSRASSPANAPGICCYRIIHQWDGGSICLVTQKEKLFIVKRANDIQPSAVIPSGFYPISWKKGAQFLVLFLIEV